ncbi:glycosyltransferase [Echria macrotheca]|uniref:Glycosyltransferase n=1 Tax=Echria macrotheca TaxID=438768 RepID=A0AAJ0BBJ8_9PEZI|nr:glycosyltransferase [Echria macrotheca]
MASTSNAQQLAALCSITSFLWLAHNLEGHQLVENPRLSSLLCLLIAGGSCFAASFFSDWLPGANGRFDDDLASVRSRASLPRKPRRFFLPVLVACIVLRLEAFHRVSLHLQCSKPGIEAWLPLVILAYELLPGRNYRDHLDRHDDMGETIFEAFGEWFTGSKAPLTTGIVLFTCGTYLASSQDPRSTFICSQGGTFIVVLQWLGLFLDAAIIIMGWRLLAWSRSTKSRLKTLGGILLTAALATGFLYTLSRAFQPSHSVAYHFRGLDSLYVFDTAVDGLAFSVFFISTSLLSTEGSPLSLVGIITFITGLFLAAQNTLLTATWQNISPSLTFIALTLVCNGFAFFVYANNLRSVMFIHRALIVFSLLVLNVAATVYILIGGNIDVDGHPLERLIYDSRVAGDRWLLRASVSNSFPVAVREYKERNRGREPPPNFDIWYQFAKDRKSIVLDHFAQIEADLHPFYGVAPEKLREDVRRVGEEPDVVVVRIQNGSLVYDSPPPQYKDILADLSAMVSTFGKHLPDGLEFALNLNDRPRVLAPYEDVKRFTKAARHGRLSRLLPRLSLDTKSDQTPRTAGRTYTTVRALREMTALTCPTGTSMRSGVHWDIRDFCSACASPQSDGLFLTNWPMALELCHQSDLLRLHGFHMEPSELRPIQELAPVFSRSKTDAYSDILLPLARAADERPTGHDTAFTLKENKLFWRGEPGGYRDAELAQGGHQERLVHLVSNASRSDQTTILLPVHKRKGKFAYEKVPTAELNAALPLDITFGLQDPSTSALYNSKYILVTDTNAGPPPNFMQVLQSNSAPFLASIFREWYTERLLPWVHFVPVDLRYHALHGTLAYFVGFGTDKLGGRQIRIEGGAVSNGKWIAEQGRQFSGKALRREDREVYLFRLLLEWARLVDDGREGLRYGG